MTNKVLHLTHPEFDVSEILANSTLLCDVTQDLAGSQYHTSLGDLSNQEILKISKKFDTINFLKNNFDTNSDIYFETLLLLNSLSHQKSITGYTQPGVENLLSLDVQHRPQEPVLWVFGCSHSYGSGLLSNELNFGQHMSAKCKMPLKLIAKPGSSISWSFRHLSDSNFRTGDIVVWQITSPERISYGFPPEEIQLSNCEDPHILETFTDQHLMFSSFSTVKQGIKFLRTQPVKFVITSISGKSPLFYPCLLEYTKYPEYCYIPKIFLDRGNDQNHPGPLSHKALAQHLLDHLQYIND
jgi:hypothetical protein